MRLFGKNVYVRIKEETSPLFYEKTGEGKSKEYFDGNKTPGQKEVLKVGGKLHILEDIIKSESLPPGKYPIRLLEDKYVKYWDSDTGDTWVKPCEIRGFALIDSPKYNKNSVDVRIGKTWKDLVYLLKINKIPGGHYRVRKKKLKKKKGETVSKKS